MAGFDGMNLVDRLRKRAEHSANACQFGDEADMNDAATEIERQRKLIHDAERELENVLVSIYKLPPEKIDNPVLRALRAASQ